jgi:uncharacterized membrane protein
MTAENARRISIGLWALLTFSLLAWGLAGYSWWLCGLAVLPLLAPLSGLVRGQRYTFAWASLFTIPYLAFAVTELLANPGARIVAAVTLLLVFGWFCSLVLFLRLSRQGPGD